MSFIQKKWIVIILTFFLVTVISTKDFEDKDEELQSLQDKKTENTTDYRLPEDVIPTEYFIRLTPFIIPNNFTFNGKVKILAYINKTTSKITLHVDLMKIHNTTISMIKKNSSPTELNVKEITRLEKYQFLNISMASPINAGTNISIEITYEGILNTDIYGFFRNSYKIKNETRWVIATQMEPTGARRVFPCFDEPRLKAVFHVTVDVPQNFAAISNTNIKTIEKGDVVEFEKTPLMSTYLLAVVVSEYQSIEMKDKGRTYKVWTNEELTYQLPYSLSVMSEAIDYFHNHLTLPYTLQKLEMVTLPDFPSVAMENWGLLTYSELFMLYNETVTPLALKMYIRGLIIHEISHQWFGNLVSPKLWDYLWLNEAFAEYFEYHAYADISSSQLMGSIFVVRELHEALSVDALNNTHSVTHKVYSPNDIRTIFDSITYNKGGSLIRMLAKLLGPNIFFGALKEYLKNNQYSFGTPELLYSSFEEEIKRNNYKLNASISEIMDSWTLQPGFPVIDAYFNEDTVTLKQRRFLLQSSNNTTNQSIWFAPLNWATRSKPDFNNTQIVTWFSSDSTTIKIENASTDWVIFNIQQIGFYRVNYDDKMWKRILNALSTESEVIHEVNRASLIDDLFNLGRVGAVNYSIVLSSLHYLSKETNYIPWKAAFTNLGYLKKRFTGHPEIYEKFKKCILSVLEPNYKRLGFDEISKEKESDILFREIVLKWMCNFEHQDCITKSFNAFEKLQRNESYSISPNQQNFIYCTVVRHGSAQEWNYLLEKFEKSNSASEKLIIMSSLACSENSSNLENLLLRIFTPEYDIKKQDVKEIITSILESSYIGIETTLNFLKANNKKLQNYDDESLIQSVLSSVGEFLPTEKLLNKFTNFVNRKSMTKFSESLQGTLQSSRFELEWSKNNFPNILKWLKTDYIKANNF